MMALLSTIGLISCDESKVEGSNSEVNNFKISILNIGKADCILIEIKDKVMMIDTGKSKNSSKVNKVLNSKEIKKIDYLILSHLDKDHIGGVPNILDNYEVGQVIQADYSKDNDEYRAYINSLEKHKISPKLPHNKINFYIEDAEINIYPGEKEKYRHSNDYSIIVDINYKNHSYLFTGDAEKERLREFLKNNSKKYDFVKVPHHGRIDDLTEKFLKSTSPKYVAITCSKESGVDEEVKEILNKLKIKSFFTCNGDIFIQDSKGRLSCYQNK